MVVYPTGANTCSRILVVVSSGHCHTLGLECHLLLLIVLVRAEYLELRLVPVLLSEVCLLIV